jgi:hypothetical protein
MPTVHATRHISVTSTQYIHLVRRARNIFITNTRYTICSCGTNNAPMYSYTELVQHTIMWFRCTKYSSQATGAQRIFGIFPCCATTGIIFITSNRRTVAFLMCQPHPITSSQATGAQCTLLLCKPHTIFITTAQGTGT